MVFMQMPDWAIDPGSRRSKERCIKVVSAPCPSRSCDVTGSSFGFRTGTAISSLHFHTVKGWIRRKLLISLYLDELP